MNKSKFPKIFVVNLKESIDRRKSIEKQLSELKLEYEICEAVNGNLLTNNEIANFYSDEKSNKTIKRCLSKEEIGCYLSHINIHKKLVEEGLANAIILEDDVILNSDIKKIVMSLLTKSEEWDLVQLYYSHACFYFWYKIKLIDKYYLRKFVNIPWGAAAYLVNLNGSKNILDNSFPIHLPFDDYLYREKFKVLKIRGLSPYCVDHIQENIIESTMRVREKIKRSFVESFPLNKKMGHFLRVNLLNLIRKFNPNYEIY